MIRGSFEVRIIFHAIFFIFKNSACGKTCLLFAFSKDKFLDDYETTVFETYVTEIQVDGHKVELVLWDTGIFS